MPLIKQFVDAYAREVDFYANAARLVQHQLEATLRANGIRAIVTSRAKRPDRLEAKLRKRAEAKGEYASSGAIREDVVDLAGVRVALYFPGQRDRVNALIATGFTAMHEPRPFPTEVPKPFETTEGVQYVKRFRGYGATHHRVRLDEGKLPDDERRERILKTEDQLRRESMAATPRAPFAFDATIVAALSYTRTTRGGTMARTRNPSKRRQPSDRVRAHHEAGHAVIGLRVGQAFGYCSIEPDPTNNTLGHVVWPPLIRSRTVDPSKGRARQRFESRIIALLAGPVAERALTGRTNGVGASGDLGNAMDLLEALVWSPEETAPYYKLLEARARALVKRDWMLITVVAQRLEDERRMSFQRVKAIVREANYPPKRSEKLASLIRQAKAAIGAADQ